MLDCGEIDGVGVVSVVEGVQGDTVRLEEETDGDDL
jgi:hypothetical protein